MEIGSSLSSSSLSSVIDKQTFGAEVVTETLNYMNRNAKSGSSSLSASYDFQNTVLSAAYTPAATGVIDIVI